MDIASYDIVCLSHLRWSFVFQRPQHLLSCCAKERRVFFFEEPVFGDEPSRLEVMVSQEGVVVAVPHIQDGSEFVEDIQAGMLSDLLRDQGVHNYVLWFYTPMALPLSLELSPMAVVYDCMDQLSAFKGAPQSLVARERLLFARADVVFTGGHSLFEAKKPHHRNVHAFPSSVDVAHFAKARFNSIEPDDQRGIAGPRLGFFGVIDERMDLALLEGVAVARPDWQLVLIGPVVKIDPKDLPLRANIHYLGSKSYGDLPQYIAHWDVALLPFAKNESTEFISPTKTPEYLAAGKPVVSTSIRDVVQPYQGLGLVRIADTVDDFVQACESSMREAPGLRRTKADAFLSRLSWHKTWREMRAHVDRAVAQRSGPRLSTTVTAVDNEILNVAFGGE